MLLLGDLVAVVRVVHCGFTLIASRLPVNSVSHFLKLFFGPVFVGLSGEGRRLAAPRLDGVNEFYPAPYRGFQSFGKVASPIP